MFLRPDSSAPSESLGPPRFALVDPKLKYVSDTYERITNVSCPTLQDSDQSEIPEEPYRVTRPRRDKQRFHPGGTIAPLILSG
jgi:hypothetical protein